MVKVLPTAFTLFEKQHIFNAQSEPLCVYCSDQYVFVACDGCLIEVHDLVTNQKISRFRTILPVSELVYNAHADCILSLERRALDLPGYARIYFVWRGIKELERPMRVIPLGSPKSSRQSASRDVDAEILQLPVENVTCLAVCELTGTIAVGSDKTIHLFTIAKDPTASLTTKGYRIESFMDIKTDMKLKKVCICGPYLCCVSTHRIRVLKFLIHTNDAHLWSMYQDDAPTSIVDVRVDKGSVKDDSNFIQWSPTCMFDRQLKSGSDLSKVNDNPKRPSYDPLSPLHHPFPFAFDRSPDVGSVTMPTVIKSMGTGRRDTGKHELEVLGPVEYIRGQPLSVTMHNDSAGKCCPLTMFYKRLASSGFAYIHSLSTEVPDGIEESIRRRAMTSYDAPKPRTKGGIHSVQLVPTFAKGTSGSNELIGMTCVFANRARGYVYNVHNKASLVSSVSFMTRCQSVSFDGQFLHALSVDSQSIDTYTSRVGSSILSNRRFSEGIIGDQISTWLQQPCPPSSLELTLISSNKFIGCTSVASSSSHVIVLSKQMDTSVPIPEKQQSFIQSWASLRRPRQQSSIAWNIYALEKKSVIDMFKQFLIFSIMKKLHLQKFLEKRFMINHDLLHQSAGASSLVFFDVALLECESAESLGQGIPPVLQHHLSEAHILLRPLVIQSGYTDYINLLRANCFQLADSFCHHSPDPNTAQNAAGYLVMSGRPICDIIDHITKTYEGKDVLPFNILLNYLNLVLFQPANKETQSDLLKSYGDIILELYMKYDCDRMADVILYSWFSEVSKEKALELLQTSVSRQVIDKSITSKNLLVISYLQCDLNLYDKAVNTLLEIPTPFLSTWAVDNYQFILDETNLTEFGQVLMNGKEDCFISIISRYLENDLVTIDGLMNMFKVDSDLLLLNNKPLKHILEDVLTSKIVLNDNTARKKAAMLLVKILFLNVFTVTSPKLPNFVQFAPRYNWLYKIYPFEENVADDVLYTTMGQSNLEYLKELQSLLCSEYMNEDIAIQINELIDGLTDTNNGVVSLKLLTWPLIDRVMEASFLMLEVQPSILVDYCRCYFKKKLNLWNTLLNELLSRVSSADKTDPQISLIYQELLLHVVTITSPEEFLKLLPPNGSISFFLPAVEMSCKIYLSRQIANNLHELMSN